jgi:RNA polymerase sigma-70 factor (ECF subfamily)
MTHREIAEREVSLSAAVLRTGPLEAERPRSPVEPGQAAEPRLEAMVSEHFDSLWRFLRQLGLPESDVDDGVQEVLMVAARRLADIQIGSERAFLMSSAVRVASTLRRARARRRELIDDELFDLADLGPSPEASLDLNRSRRLLDAVLDQLPTPLRAIFVLYELEELTMAEIAALLDLPPGTVASRLRRARARFDKKIRAIEAEFNRRERRA